MDPNEAPMEMNQLIGSLVVHYVLDNDLRALAATNRVMLGLVLGSGNARLHMRGDGNTVALWTLRIFEHARMLIRISIVDLSGQVAQRLLHDLAQFQLQQMPRRFRLSLKLTAEQLSAHGDLLTRLQPLAGLSVVNVCMERDVALALGPIAQQLEHMRAHLSEGDDGLSLWLQPGDNLLAFPNGWPPDELPAVVRAVAPHVRSLYLSISNEMEDLGIFSGLRRLVYTDVSQRPA